MYCGNDDWREFSGHDFFANVWGKFRQIKAKYFIAQFTIWMNFATWFDGKDFIVIAFYPHFSHCAPLYLISRKNVLNIWKCIILILFIILYLFFSEIKSENILKLKKKNHVKKFNLTKFFFYQQLMILHNKLSPVWFTKQRCNISVDSTQYFPFSYVAGLREYKTKLFL